MSNLFFQAALKKSTSLARKYSQILHLVVQLGVRLRKVDWKAIKDQGAKEKLVLIGRFAKAYAVETYRSVSSKTIVMVVTVIIYFINPMDLIPDLMPIVGLTDDVGILLWVYKALGSEVDKFITWEKNQLL